MIFCLGYVLERSSNLDESVKLMGINRTYGYSFIVADGNINQAKVLEMTWHRYYNGMRNDPQESNGYNVEQYPIEDAVRRGESPCGISNSAYEQGCILYALHGGRLHPLRQLLRSWEEN